MVQIFKYKYDSYTKRRGAPALLVIKSACCGRYIMCYQKDGPGPLLRCYIDRIHHPPHVRLQKYSINKHTDLAPLVCVACNIIIGVPMLYEKEKRPAYEMQESRFTYARFNKRDILQ